MPARRRLISLTNHHYLWMVKVGLDPAGKMNVIVFASRKGGSGKSTLTAHLAAHASKPSRRCLLVDADPQGSLTLWHKLRSVGDLTLKSGTRDLGEVITAARREGYHWAFVDTPPNMSAVVIEAIRFATLVIVPARLAVFDLAAIKETIDLSRQSRKPYAVVINAAPARRDNTESPFVTESREVISKLNVPVWSGQITNRADYVSALGAGLGVTEYNGRSQAALEIAQLWSAIRRSVKAIDGVYRTAGVMHRVAA
jgi:chromosome partitioning protein